MAAHIELPFLYQTRTILRCHCHPRVRVTCTTPRRRLVSSRPHRHPHPETPGNHDAPESDKDKSHGGFLREKARQVAGSSKAPSSIPDTVGTRINSTITASERRAFETILRFTPKQAEPSSVKQRSPFVDAVDTDVENILSIFSSSIKSYHADRDRDEREARRQEPEPKAGPFHALTCEPSQTFAREPKVGALDAEESASAATLRPERVAPETTAQATKLQEGQSRAPERLDVDTEAPNLPLSEPSLEEISRSLQLSRFDASIQHAVRTRMTEIAEALQSAATSTTKRGDLAMWEVCERQIFSMASHLAPPREKRAKLAEPPRFTFTKAHSDNAPELIEAAARASASGQHGGATTDPVASSLHEATSASASTATATTSLPVLHHVYPAALLLALRLYIHHFPGSPLAHDLLPRIRAFGHTSYVLGAGPQFYNSLLSLVWLTRSSLRQVDGLLAEMERGGVELTEETYRILRQIEDERAADLGREEGHAGVLKGSRGGAWWKRHEQVFWFPRILDWLAVVAKRLTMRDMAEAPLQ
ncbi:hypothetical protein A1O3_01918 [Capronia epimyces CBS 606.96]|uniref:Mtf2-like C-terminal domain-containing protein n=1 Tax=Capronia epimyces CBS 606.96 TaxID=1182542 RepID=W9Z2Z3_9EURO|nr:uncharacterized protein A1O3_01918 [Capronia epimyces CBS 606.96]EXJ88854.1 hypothetical protein A1O3_01918 [Capronia epimyces CBS 606.96]